MKFAKALLSATALAFLAGCATGNTTVVAAPAAQTQHFQAVRIEQGQNAVEADAAQISLFETTLRQRLTAAGFSDGEGLTVRYRVTEYHPGNRAARYFAGPFAGKGHLMIEVVYLDQSGAELSRINVGGEISMGAFGGDFGGATRQAAEEASQFAVQHFKG
jgi:hypothetical protein